MTPVMGWPAGLGVVQEPVNGGRGSGFGHELVEAGRVGGQEIAIKGSQVPIVRTRRRASP